MLLCHLLCRMETRTLMFVGTIVLLAAMLSAAALSDLGYTVEKYDTSPGVYYENKGIAVLYGVEWKTIVYVDIGKLDNETLALRQYVHHIDMLCQMSIVRNWTGCAHFNDIRHPLDQLTRTEGLLREITGQRSGGRRRKRGVFNFIGELSKILFGTLDEDDAKYYNEQIRLFEQNSEDRYTDETAIVCSEIVARRGKPYFGRCGAQRGNFEGRGEKSY